MKIKGLHTDILLEPHDYFFVSGENNTICITLTDKSRRPLKLCGISRRQWYALASQVQRLMLAQDSDKVEAIITKATEEPLQDTLNRLAVKVL